MFNFLANVLQAGSGVKRNDGPGGRGEQPRAGEGGGGGLHNSGIKSKLQKDDEAEWKYFLASTELGVALAPFFPLNDMSNASTRSNNNNNNNNYAAGAGVQDCIDIPMAGILTLQKSLPEAEETDLMEDIIYHYYSATLSPFTKELLHQCSPSDPPHSPGRTTFRTAAPSSISASATPTPGPQLVPWPLVSALQQRWWDVSQHAHDKAPEEHLLFLSRVLPKWCALIDVGGSPAVKAQLRSSAVFHEAITVSVKIAQESVAMSSGGQGRGANAASLAKSCNTSLLYASVDVLGILQLLLHLLLAVHCPHAPCILCSLKTGRSTCGGGGGGACSEEDQLTVTAADLTTEGRVTGLTNAQLLEGYPRRYWTSSPTAVPLATHSQQQSSSVDEDCLPSLHISLALELASFCLRLSKGTLLTTIARERNLLISLFVLQEGLMLPVVAANPAYYASVTAKSEAWATALASAASILLARYVSLDDKDAQSEESVALLHEIVLSLTCIAGGLTDAPVPLAEAMNGAFFFDNLTSALRKVGRLFRAPMCPLGACDEGDNESGEVEKGSKGGQVSADIELCPLHNQQRQLLLLRKLASRDSLQSLQLSAMTVPHLSLEAPALSTVAEMPLVDELLHAYMGLLAAQRRARAALVSHKEPQRLVAHMDQLGLTPLSSLHSPDWKKTSDTIKEEEGDNAELSVDRDVDNSADAQCGRRRGKGSCDMWISCLDYMLIKHTLQLISRPLPTSTAVTVSIAAAAGGPTSISANDIAQLQFLEKNGLYRFLLTGSGDEHSLASIYKDHTLLYAIVFLFNQLLTIGLSKSKRDRLIVGGATGPASSAVSTESAMIDVEVNALVACLSASSSCAYTKKDGSSSSSGNSKIRAAEWSSVQAPVFSLLCATLLHSLRGPFAAIIAVTLAENMFKLVATALHLADCFPFLNCRSSSGCDSQYTTSRGSRTRLLSDNEESSVAMPFEWLQQVLIDVTSSASDAAQARVLERSSDAVISLFSRRSLHACAVRVLTSLLCHRGTCTVAGVRGVPRVELITARVWELVGCCEGLPGSADFFAPSPSSSSDIALAPPGSASQDAVLLALLSSVRAAVNVLAQDDVGHGDGVNIGSQSGDARPRLKPLRFLQSALCTPSSGARHTEGARAEGGVIHVGGGEGKGDAFLRIIHRISLPWESYKGTSAVAPTATATPAIEGEQEQQDTWGGIRPVLGIAALLNTLTCLVMSNPSLRALLFDIIRPAELVNVVCSEWLAAEPENVCGVAAVVVGLVYEEMVSDAGVVGEEEEEEREEGTVSLASIEGSHRSAHNSSRKRRSGDSTRARQKCKHTMQNIALLSPLLANLAHLLPVSSCGDASSTTVGENSITTLEPVIAALTYVFDRMGGSALGCRASLVAMSSADGLVEALAELSFRLQDPTVASSEASVALLQRVVALLSLLASYHIDVRQMKQLMVSALHTHDAAQRLRTVPVLSRVVSRAVRAYVARQHEPQRFLAFKAGSGPVGIKVPFKEFPGDGYTLAMWLRFDGVIEGAAGAVYGSESRRGQQQNQQQPPAAHCQFPQCIYSILNSDRKACIAVYSTNGRLSVMYQSPTRGTQEVTAGDITLPAGSWVHLIFVQRSTQVFHGSKVLQVYVNGVESGTIRNVEFATTLSASLYVGTRGEDVEQKPTRHALVGQIAELFFFERAMAITEVHALYCTSSSANKPSSQHKFVHMTSSSSRGPAMAGVGAGVPPFATVAASPTTATISTAMAPTEGQWIMQASVCIDPCLGESGQLYNLAALLKDRPCDTRIVLFEGTEVCNGNNIVDAVCVLGAMYTVVMPLFAILINASLPFPRTITDFTFVPELSIVQQQQKQPASGDRSGGVDTLMDLLDLLGAIASIKVVRGELGEAGVFVLLGYVLQQLGPLISIEVPQKAMEVCTALLLSADDAPSSVSSAAAAAVHLFTSAYTSLFLSSGILHACAGETQLMWINIQRITAAADNTARMHMKAAGAQLFTVVEFLRQMHISEEREQADCTASPSPAQMREQLLLFFEALAAGPITMSDALVIDFFVQCVSRQYYALNRQRDREEQKDDKEKRKRNIDTTEQPLQGQKQDILYEVLRRIRLLIVSQGALLAQLLGRCGYTTTLAHLYATYPSTWCPRVRQELQLQLVLLAMRSRRAQELLSTAGLAVGDVSALAAAATAGNHKPESNSSSNATPPLAGASGGGTVVHPMNSPSLVWMGFSMFSLKTPDTSAGEDDGMGAYMALRCGMLADFGVRHVPTAYVPVTPTCRIAFAPAIPVILTLLREPSTSGALRARALTDLSVLLKDDAMAWRQLQSCDGWYAMLVDLCDPVQRHQQKELNENDAVAIFTACEMILSYTLFYLLARDDTGAAELRLAVAYMKECNTPRLLNGVLVGIMEQYRRLLQSNTQGGVTACYGFGSSVSFSNFTASVYVVEDVLFYSAPANPSLVPAQNSHSAHIANAEGHAHAVAGPLPPAGSPYGRSAASSGNGGTFPVAPVTLVANTGRLHGYTEWEELVITDKVPLVSATTAATILPDATGQSNWSRKSLPSSGLLASSQCLAPCHSIVETPCLGGDARLELLRNPDGRWLHTALALKVAALIGTSSALLNCGTTTTMSVGTAGPTTGELLLSMLAGADARASKGGFLRVFIRLVRVACTFTLTDVPALRSIIALADCLARFSDKGPTGVLASLTRAHSIEDYREHSSLATALVGVNCLYQLLLRRIRVGTALLMEEEQSRLTERLVLALQRLVGTFRKPLEQLSLFMPLLREEAEGERFTNGKTTFQWLCSEGAASQNLSTAPNGQSRTIDAFVEIASRSDFNTFIEKCAYFQEKGQATDKQLVSAVYAVQEKTALELRSFMAEVRRAHAQVMLGMMELVRQREEQQRVGDGNNIDDDWQQEVEREQEGRERESTAAGSECHRSEAATVSQALASPRNIPMQATPTVITTMRADVWMRLVEHTQGTMWGYDPRHLHRPRYVRLGRKEQHQLMRRKIIYDKDGTDHASVTTVVCSSSANTDGINAGAARRDDSPAKGESGGVVAAAEGEDFDVQKDEVDNNPLESTTTRLRLRGGEEVLLAVDDEGRDDGTASQSPPSPVLDVASTNAQEDKQQIMMMTPATVSPMSNSGVATTTTTTRTTTTTTATATTARLLIPLSQSPSPAPAATAAPAAAIGTVSSGVITIPCEVPFMMHCWSAMVTLRGPDVVIIFDETNSAYNQAIAKEALAFLMKPKDSHFSLLHVESLAPGRRFRMKRTAIEVWLRNKKSFFLNFADATTMRLVVDRIVSTASRLRAATAATTYVPRFYLYHENPKREPLRLHYMSAWQRRDMTNFDYLLWLNLLAGRSVNDVTQYPVFPWVIADYTSETLDLTRSESFRDLRQPIGVCGDSARREAVQRRYEEMKELGDVPSHYFTHYSSPAVTLYYMVRLEPFTTLQILLQGGHFDHADRMFHSMRACYRSVTASTQDVRELIPELYYLPELCQNNNDVRFGQKQDNSSMCELVLPPWAHGSPHEFIYKMREALECDYVSAMLHHWIDLIFGYKQRGKEAIDSVNVFNWHSYEEIDRSSRGGTGSHDAVDEHLLIDCLDNIGQTPIQLFRRPHEVRAPNYLADPTEAKFAVKIASHQRWGCTSVACVAVTTDERIVVVSAASGAAASFKLYARPVHKRSALEMMPVLNLPARIFTSPLTLPEPTGWARATTTTTGGGTAGSANAGSRTVSGVSSSARSPAPPFQSTRSAVSVGVLPGGAGGGGAAGAAAHVSSSGSGGYDLSSFEMADELEYRLAGLPAGVVPRVGGSSGAAEGPCRPENTLVLHLEGNTFVALGGMYDHSILIRHLSGSAAATADVRLRGHCGRVVVLARSEDSQFMVSGSEDTTFAVWTCHMVSQAPHTLRAELLFSVHSHEELATAADLCSSLDLVATASADGVLMFHSLGSGSLDRTLVHPSNFPVDRVLIQSHCYVPNVLYASNTDHIIHQVSINGTPLRTCALHGKITCWGVSPGQHLLVGCTPYSGRGSAGIGANNKSGVSGVAAGEASFSSNAPVMVLLHSFYLEVAKREVFSSIEGSVLTSVACHPSNVQVTVAGTATGEVVQFRLVMD